MRAEVALGRFDDALRTAKTMFAMSRHLGEHPTFVGNLYGIAIANLAIGPLEEMLEQPGCPNLYWALTNLPNPLVSLETAMQGERIGMIQWMFRDLDDGAPMTPDRLNRFIADLTSCSKLVPSSSARACGRGWTRGPRTRGRSRPHAAAWWRSACRR